MDSAARLPGSCLLALVPCLSPPMSILQILCFASVERSCLKMYNLSLLCRNGKGSTGSNEITERDDVRKKLRAPTLPTESNLGPGHLCFYL